MINKYLLNAEKFSNICKKNNNEIDSILINNNNNNQNTESDGK